MLTDIQLKNFKALKDTGTIEFGHITVLVGPNSSGKSSVIQALLAGRQTARNQTEGALVLADGEDFNLGSFPEVRRRGTGLDLDLHFGVTTVFAPRSVLRTIPSHVWKARGTTLNGFLSAEIAYLTKTRETYVKTIGIAGYRPQDAGRIGDVDLPKANMIGVCVVPGSNRYKWVYKNTDATTTEKRSKRLDSRFFSLPSVVELWYPRRFMSSAEQLPEAAIQHLMAVSIAQAVEQDLKGLRHVGAMRADPRRAYALKGTRPPEVGNRGERAPDIILAETRRKKSRDKLMNPLNAALQKVGISSTIKARIPSGGSAFSLLLEHLTPKISGVNLASVGFGVSQILPILVEAFHAERGSLILLEQPEIHLQPSAQSRIADILLDVAIAGDKRFLVETHSEHFIRRLQVLVAEKRVRAERIKIYFFQPSQDGSDIIELHIGDDGRLDREWPIGFFDEGIRLSMEHLTAIQAPEKKEEQK
jgi:hypothetical protein